jgi:hypothetical protein
MRYMSSLGIVQDSHPITLTNAKGEVTQYPADFPKSEIPGLEPIVETPCAVTPTQIAVESIRMIDGIPTQEWDVREKTEEELAAEVKARVPFSVTPLQGELAIKKAYPEAYAKLKEIISSLKDDDDMKIAFNRALEWQRNSPTTLKMLELLGIGEADADVLYIEATKIEV